MKQETIEIINNISKLDTDVQAIVLLRINETITWLYNKIDDDVELEEWLGKVMIRNESTDDLRNMVTYCGFTRGDDVADEYFDEYYESEESNRMDILKKQLIEWAIESENM